MHKKFRTHSRLFRVAFVFIFALVVLVGAIPAKTYADYDCGTYGAGNYDTTTNYENSDCTTASTTTSSSSTGKTTDAVASTPDTPTPTENVTQQATINLDDYPEYVQGKVKTLSLTVGQIIYFTLNNKQHTITIKAIAADNVVVTIASTPHDVTIPLNQTVNDDVDGNGTKDIAISYFSSSNGVAVLGFRQLPVDTAAAATDTKATPANYMWLLWVGLAIVIIGIIIAIIIARRRRDKYTSISPILPN